MSLNIETKVSDLVRLDKDRTNIIKSFSPQQRLQLIGSITHLMMNSPLHRSYNISDEIEQQYISGQYVLNLDEWQGGNNLWFPEFIAPFGHTRFIVRDLRTNVLPKGTPAKSFRIRPDGSLRSIANWKL